MNIIEVIDNAIEKELDKQLEKFDYTEQTIIELGVAIEIMFAEKKFMLGNSFLPLLEIIIEKLMRKEYKRDKRNNDLLLYYKLLEVAGDYHILRDYIYYSYANKSSINWKQNKDKIEIRVLDKSIFRQLVHNNQTLFLNSSKMSEHKILSIDEVLLSLKDKDEFDFNNDQIIKVINSIEQEAKIKIKSFFSYIPSDSKIKFDNYTYCEFVRVYTELLELALYRRYFSYANNLPSVIIYDSQELSGAMSNALKMDEKIILSILKDISYSSRGTLNYIIQDKIFVMYLTCFSLFDGITNMLKYYAVKNPKGYSSKFADIIGEALVNDIESAFLKYENFRCIKDKKLNKYSQKLPDIDLLAISYEPSLGFHIFACEVKNVLLPTWAKDYLKSYGEKGYITKALYQIDQISKFLKTEEGQKMLYQIVLEKFSYMDLEKVLPHGFCVVIDYLIITSENIGVLCDDTNKSIVSVAMLKEIIDKSDGDVNYIKACLNNLNLTMDKCLNVINNRTVLNELNIEYDACSSDTILQFEQNYYISNGTYKELEVLALDTGYSFIDGVNCFEDVN